MVIIDYKSIKSTLEYIIEFVRWNPHIQGYHPIIIDNAYTDIAFPKELLQYGDVRLFGKIEGRDVYELTVNMQKIYYCSYGDNAGFAKGNNLGAKLSRQFFQDSYYLFSNNDIVFSMKFPFDRYKQIMQEYPEIGVIGPRVQTPSGTEQSPCKKVRTIYLLFGQIWGFVIPFIKVKGDIDFDGISKKCYWTSGCFMFVRASAFDEVGGFDENTFLYAEEMIFSERLSKCQYVYYFDSEYQIVHMGGAVIKKNGSALRIIENRFNSACYYSHQYRGVSNLILKLAKINFKICKRLLVVKDKLKNIMSI